MVQDLQMALMTSLPVRWAIGGWGFFIAENFVLSENRTWLIDRFGDEGYHAAYGLCSTAATASIGYAYYKIRKTTVVQKTLRPTSPTAVGAWLLVSLGLGMVSQVPPKLQIPVHAVQSPPAPLSNDQSSAPPPLASGEWKFQVRCPFDFTDQKNTSVSGGVHGLERITRHPGLWAMGLVGLGQASLATSLPLRVWWTGPALVAWIGGGHTDSRYRRGMGGRLTPEEDAQTSNLPFWALVNGAQGDGAMGRLVQETKPLNLALAVLTSSLWVLKKVR